MAHNRDYKPEDIAFPEQVITQSELIGEMEKSYLEYAMSVIVGRALPDVRDGLKPVHRRILYAMYEDGLTSDKPFKKSATCVGDVLGRYHPHGDASVYDAMVRLAQTFSMRYTLVEGHGNFGSVDGDPPAAYRYTEARMSKICNEMLRDIDKETVEWIPNFDESRKEPLVLPSRFPNLLVNGSSGIAVGMATNIPPHNLGEVIDATVCLLENPEATLDDLMEYLKGPDFPTRGIIIGRSGIRDAYKTGRGKIIVRARTHFEEFGKDKRTRIIVTELPYQVNKRMLIKTIGEQVKDKKLEGISDLRDETDRNGMRIVIELKKDANEQVVLNHLLSQTQMQSSFSVIMLALVENQRQPKVLTLHEVLREYIKFQEELLVKRIKFDLKKALERAHLLEGLIKAQENIDEVIRIIRNAYDDAKEQLCQAFDLDDVQAQAILDMRLKALQGLDREKLKNELTELNEKIKHYNELLASEEMLRDLLKEELLAIKEKYADERVTEISDSYDDIDDEDLIPRHTCIITRTHGGYIKRIPADTYEAQNKGGKGVIGMNSKEEDYIEDVMAVSSHSTLMMFTNKGKVQVMKAYKLPEGSRQAKGGNLVNMLNLDTDNNEKVTNILSVNGFEEAYLTFVTKNGIIKRCSTKDFEHINKAGKRAISLDEGDELLYVGVTYGENELLIASSYGKAVRFNENQARCMGRNARGVKAISLKEGDKVVGVTPVLENCDVLIMTENGYGKRSSYEEFRTMLHRGGQGVKCFNISEKTGNVVGIANIVGDEDMLIITDGGQVIRTPVDNIVPHKRTAGGVIVMRLRDTQKIASFTLVAQKVEVKEEEAETNVDAVPENLAEENAEENSEE